MLQESTGYYYIVATRLLPLLFKIPHTDRWTSLKYIYFPNEFFAILHNLLVLMFRLKTTIAKLIK